MQIPPSAHLSHIVKHFLVLEYDRHEQAALRLFSDGHPGMIIHYGQPFIQQDGTTGTPQPIGFLYGQVSKFHNVMAGGHIGLLAVVFQPYGIHALLGFPVCRLTDGSISMKQLANTLNASERTLERKFRDTIGLSPKHFAGVIRLRYFLKAIHNKNSLTSLAYECGYHDQAHLIREFKKTVGLSPLKYRSATLPLAVNFIRLPA